MTTRTPVKQTAVTLHLRVVVPVNFTHKMSTYRNPGHLHVLKWNISVCNLKENQGGYPEK